MTQCSICLKRSAIRAQVVYFLHSTSATFLWLSDVSVICRVTYFQFLIQSAFIPYIGRQAAQALRRTIDFNTQYQTSDFAENLGRYVSYTEFTVKGKDLEISIDSSGKTGN